MTTQFLVTVTIPQSTRFVGDLEAEIEEVLNDEFPAFDVEVREMKEHKPTKPNQP